MVMVAWLLPSSLPSHLSLVYSCSPNHRTSRSTPFFLPTTKLLLILHSKHHHHHHTSNYHPSRRFYVISSSSSDPHHKTPHLSPSPTQTLSLLLLHSPLLRLAAASAFFFLCLAAARASTFGPAPIPSQHSPTSTPHLLHHNTDTVQEDTAAYGEFDSEALAGLGHLSLSLSQHCNFNMECCFFQYSPAMATAFPLPPPQSSPFCKFPSLPIPSHPPQPVLYFI